MILAALLLQAAAPQTALDAERAFAATAQAKGQWTASREFAAEDAVMFVPQPVKAQEWLKDRQDPPKSVEWWPTKSYVSCDGNTAVNIGGWKRPGGSVGTFTTIWRRQADGGWKWIYDGGDTLDAPLPAPVEPEVIRPDCAKPAPAYILEWVPDGGSGASRDYSLIWKWSVAPDGTRRFGLTQWNGAYQRSVLNQSVTPAP